MLSGESCSKKKRVVKNTEKERIRRIWAKRILQFYQKKKFLQNAKQKLKRLKNTTD